MAIMNEEQQTQVNSNPLQVSASEFYFTKMRPFMEEMLMLCKSDPVLIETTESVINHADSHVQRSEWDKVREDFESIISTVSDQAYFVNTGMKRGSEEEKKKVTEFIKMYGDFSLIMTYEKPQAGEEPNGRERIDYTPTPGSGFNNSYERGRTMEKLNEPNPKERIPNK